MGIYALCLAGSNFFAPVICGFIADGMNWKWVFYFPAIFLACALVFCFFCMEETNYHRLTVGIVEVPSRIETVKAAHTGEKTDEDNGVVHKELRVATVETGWTALGSNKTFLQRLSLWQPSPGQSMLGRAVQSLKYLTWPIIFYAGFSYGSYLVSSTRLVQTRIAVL